MGDGVSQAAQTFLPPSAPRRREGGSLTHQRGSLAFNGIVSAVAFPGVFTNSATVASIMRAAAPSWPPRSSSTARPWEARAASSPREISSS